MWPALQGIALFADERFNQGDGLHFNYVTNRFLSDEEVMATRAYSQQKLIVDVRRRQQAGASYVRVAFLVFAVAALAFAVIQIRKSRLRQKP